MIRMVFMNKEEGWLYGVGDKVKEFENLYKGYLYFKKNKLEEKGFVIRIEGIDKEKNSECLKYL